MTDQANIQRLFKEKAIQQNRVTAVTIEAETIYVSLESEVAGSYERSDCAAAVKVEKHDSEIIEVQGLGVQGCAVRYCVKRQRVAYLNDAGQFVTFTLAIPGIRLDLLVTEEVVERALYLLIDYHFSFPVTVALLNKLDQVQTSDSALERWRKQAAAALPSVGELIQALNEKKLSALHLDEYKANGTKGWELMLRDEHGRLLFSIRLKARSARQIQAILRWLRLLGLQIQTFYADFWLAYPVAIRAVYPKAHIPYDFFHVIQNIHRHLSKALTAYRKTFKTAQADAEQRELNQALHKKLWENRYLLFTNPENLSPQQQQTLDELLLEHKQTLVEQIVTFRGCLRDLFNDSTSFQEASERLACLLLDGWDALSTAFAKVFTFLQDHFDNMLTYLRIPGLQRYSCPEPTIPSIRRIEFVRQGFKSQAGRSAHFKLLLWRSYLLPAHA